MTQPIAVYFAMRIKVGALDYFTVFSKETFEPFQEDTDLILIADGYAHLIVPIV